MASKRTSSSSSARSRWAARTLWNILWIVVGVLGITTLNGYAASGFSHIPNAFLQIFGPMIMPLPKPPAGYHAVTPASLAVDFGSQKNVYLGQDVSIYGRMLPWEDITEGRLNKTDDLHITGLKARSGTFLLALYADPEEHPEMSARPLTIAVRVNDEWRNQHSGMQGQWVQVLGTVVAYSPGAGQASPEIQSKSVEIIPEPYDIYDHGLPIPKPGSDEHGG